ncbi:hypothetical protein BO82DRAFT_350450 [Aspergillus uvarum CBS 121591]|uniref:Uncharacterized protein n=1 Tax=Aspergillus uvarum CBS 121591 TaxID=1448315 RepID=A0A319DDJ8_9EURO|nr:hypothetical protein BO82DRAFT_350450 [Aspergillus uvarum CBS 121591]PYH86158.1 hypothetical protein BO82DRAFT_350450 [Aspergillus uvarum CBS 121591]
MAASSAQLKHHQTQIDRFYDIVYLLKSLSQVRGERIKQKCSLEKDGYRIAKFRRDLADALAYIAAYKKNPDYVTAAALTLSEDGEEVIVWVAANKVVEPGVIEFLKEVLHILSGISDRTHRPQGPYRAAREQDFQEDGSGLLSCILKFNSERNFAYYTSFLKTWEEDISPSEGAIAEDEDVRRLNEWIIKTFHRCSGRLAKEDMVNFAQECHKARTGYSEVFDTLKQLTHRYKNGLGNKFERLHKLLLKLGKHITVHKKLIQVRRSLQKDFDKGFEVRAVPKSSQTKIRSLRKGKFDLNNISRHLYREKDDLAAFFSHLEKFHDVKRISEDITKACKSGGRVHAEIQLIDHFDRTRCQFLDKDSPYIGCSKPACYLCYYYIAEHPNRYYPPSSHQKIYNIWCLPTLYQGDHEASIRFNAQKRFLKMMTEKLCTELRTEIANQREPRTYHADSTAGVTSTIYSHTLKQENLPQLYPFQTGNGTKENYRIPYPDPEEEHNDEEGTVVFKGRRRS